MINDFFGVNVSSGSGRRNRAQKGGDVRADVTLTFEEAAFGKKTEVRIKRHETCEQCKGTGSAGGKQPGNCSTCAGRGQVLYRQGLFSVPSACATTRHTKLREASPSRPWGDSGCSRVPAAVSDIMKSSSFLLPTRRNRELQILPRVDAIDIECCDLHVASLVRGAIDWPHPAT